MYLIEGLISDGLFCWLQQNLNHGFENEIDGLMIYQYMGRVIQTSCPSRIQLKNSFKFELKIALRA